MVRGFEGFVEGPVLVATFVQCTSEVFVFLCFGFARGNNAVCPVIQGFNHCQFVFQRVVRVKGQILVSVRRFPVHFELKAAVFSMIVLVSRKGSMLS